MVGKLAVVAIGGNSLITDPKKPDVQHQWEAVHETCKHIAQMIAVWECNNMGGDCHGRSTLRDQPRTTP